MSRTQLAYCVEIDTYQPLAVGAAPPDAWGTMAWGTDSELADVLVPPGITLRASDIGYRAPARPAVFGTIPFPPYLASGVSYDRRINLDPTQAAVSAAAGTISLLNDNGRYDVIGETSNAAGRGVRIYAMPKSWSDARGVWTDLDNADYPATPLFAGAGLPWALNETTLDVPVRDVSYLIERPLQPTSYGGTGGLDGTISLLGKPKPKLRCLGASAQALNITPVLVDPVALIYQFNDGIGTAGVNAVYEGGAAVFTSAGVVADLYVGTTPSGQYRVDQARGLFQLGSTPVGQITADVWQTPASNPLGAGLFSLLGNLLIEMGAASASVTGGNFAAMDASYASPLIAAAYFGPTPVDGATVIGQMAAAAGGVLFVDRAGIWRVFRPQPPAAGAVPADTWDTTKLISVKPVALPGTLDPPPYRWRVGYAQNWTVQTSGLNGTVTATRQSFLALATSYAGWVSRDVLMQWLAPPDSAPMTGVLCTQGGAQAVADGLGAMWGVRRYLFDAVLASDGVDVREFGDLVKLIFPVGALRAGAIGQIVGEQFDSVARTVTYQVLV